MFNLLIWNKIIPKLMMLLTRKRRKVVLEKVRGKGKKKMMIMETIQQKRIMV